MAVCFLTPIYTASEKRPLISDHIKGRLVAAFRSPLMKALDRSVETLGLWIVTSSVTFIKSTNQSSVKLCLITISCVQPITSCVCKILYSLDVCKYAQRHELIRINRFYHMARLALLARFHRKADVCKAGRVSVSRRPFLEMPGNLTGSRQYFKIKILGREKQPGNLSIPFCFFS